MARNRGKRPGAASGSASRSQNQGEKSGDVSAKGNQADGGKTAPAAASSAIAAKIDAPAAGAAKTGSGGTTASQAGASAKSSSTSAAAASATRSTASGAKTSSSPAATSAKATASSTTASRTSDASKATGNVGGKAGDPSGVPPATGGFWPGVAGGVIGGAATALAASLFWVGGDDDAATAALESRLAAAEQQMAQVTELNDRMAAVEAAPSGGDAADDDLQGRLDDLETKFAGLGDATAGGDGENVGDRLAALEQRIDGLANDMQTAGEAQQASIATLAGVESALPTLEQSLAATGKSVEDVGSRTTELSETVGTLDGEVKTLAGRLGETESRLDHLGGEYQRGAAMIVAIGDVDRAITKAEPFDSALQSLKLLLRDEEILGGTLSTLEPMAVDGVPTSDDLKAEFGEMASSVLLAETGDRSLADQVGDNVFGIFNVRPSGAEVEGSDSRAILSRAQARVGGNDLQAAIGELEGLEGVAAETAATWIERARARLSAEAAVVDLRAHAQALVAKGT